MIINLIATPRNLSTALMYSFRQRSDMTVIDEPFFGVFLAQSDAYRPSRTETMAEWPLDYDSAMEWIRASAQMSSHLFLKNMASHHIGFPWDYLLETTNLFVLRHPGLSIQSIHKQIESPNREDVGLHAQRKMFEYVRSRGQNPVVIDSENLLHDPESYLQGVCLRLGLPWDQAMLHWKAGPKPEDGPWAKYWYNRLHSSTGFAPYSDRPKVVPPHLTPLYEDCLEDYLYLKHYEIQ